MKRLNSRLFLSMFFFCHFERFAQAISVSDLLISRWGNVTYICNIQKPISLNEKIKNLNIMINIFFLIIFILSR